MTPAPTADDHLTIPKLIEICKEMNASAEYKNIAIETIDMEASVAMFQLRPISDVGVQELRKKMTYFDKAHPLKVFALPGGKFLLVDGRHRYTAAMANHFKEVSVLVLKDPGNLAEIQLRAVLMCIASGTSNPNLQNPVFFIFWGV